jgi:peptidoglycan hydrolase-like protein with peptidoglycan-binding domain
MRKNIFKNIIAYALLALCIIGTKHTLANFQPTTPVTGSVTVDVRSAGGGGGGSAHTITPDPVVTPTPAVAPQAGLPAAVSSSDCSVFTRKLMVGVTGTDVVLLQKFLALNNDGKFGPITAKAVSAFQAKYSLTPVDGIAGVKTQAKLKEVYCGAPVQPAPVPAVQVPAPVITIEPTAVGVSSTGSLKVGMSGEDVRKVQMLLVRLGYSVKVDGKFGPGTESVVIKFQKDHQLTPDGVVGSSTLELLKK